jgi:hypothetical protein
VARRRGPSTGECRRKANQASAPSGDVAALFTLLAAALR